MGKSFKKSTPKVEAAPAVVPLQSGKKGKREAEETPEKQVAVKKQKKNAGVAQAIIKNKVEAKGQKKKKDESSSSSDDSSDSEDEPASLQKQPTIAKNGSVPTKKAKKASSSDSSESSSEEDSSSDEEPTQKAALPTSVAKNVPSVTANGKTASSDSSSEEDSDEEDVKKATAVTKVSAPTPKKIEDSSSSSSDDSDSDEEEAPSNKVPVASKRPLTASGIEQSNQESDDSEDDSSDETEDEKPAVKKSKVASNNGKDAKVVKKVSSSEEEESEESSDDDEEIDEEETPKNKETDVEMVDATTPQKIAKQQDLKSGKKAPQTPATPQVQSTGSKTLFVGNLTYQIEQADVNNFFKDAGEIVEIRFATDAEGNFKGYGHVEFATAEAAQKALELNGEYLLNRSVRLDLARERGAYTPQSSNGNNSFQKGGRGQARTLFVKGFDQSLGEDEIKSSLEEHFGSCGEISRVAIPVDRETGVVKGFAYLDFTDGDSLNKALELNGSELNNCTLSVDEAKPKGEFRDGPGSGRGGGRSGRRDGGGRGRWSGGRDGGGRGGRRGGGRFGGAGRGRGTPNKPNLAAAGTGKKTTFNNED